MNAEAVHSDVADYDYWQRAIAITEGKRSLTRAEMQSLGLTHEAGCGFFRRRLSRAGQFVPVALFVHAGTLVAVADGTPTDPSEVWTYCAPHAITEELYHERMKTGRWPDEDEAVTASLATPGAGHNSPPQDEADILAAQIEAASANAKAYENITDDETASKAQSARARLNELAREADKKREKSKAPHLEASRAVDKKWKPVIDMAESAALKIRNALSAHETRKAREAAEAARKAEAEQRALREQLAQHPEAPPEYVAAVAVAPAPPAEVPKAQIKGAYGKAAAVKVVKVARVVDYEKAVPFFATNAEVRALVDKLAQRAVDAGITPPGVEVTEERVVR